MTQPSKRKSAKPQPAGEKPPSESRSQKARDDALEAAKARERARQRSGSDD